MHGSVACYSPAPKFPEFLGLLSVLMDWFSKSKLQFKIRSSSQALMFFLFDIQYLLDLLECILFLNACFIG